MYKECTIQLFGAMHSVEKPEQGHVAGQEKKDTSENNSNFYFKLHLNSSEN